MQIRAILHPTDFSPYSEQAFHLACSLARDHGARLLVLHVAPEQVPYYGELAMTPPHHFIEEKLRETLKQIKSPDPAVALEHRYEEGDAATAILDTAQSQGCDLIVMGTHGRTGVLDRLLMGSVAEAVMRGAPCPVVTVKPRRGP